MATAVGKEQGKSEFVRAALGRDPKANPTTVNQAWKATGHSGDISGSLVHKIRADMGLTGNLRSRSKVSRYPGVSTSRRGFSSRASGRDTEARGNGTQALGGTVTKSGSTDRARVLEDLESEIDRLIFRIMGMEELPEVEEALRRARRLLVLSHSR